jgi:hypothetical protein
VDAARIAAPLEEVMSLLCSLGWHSPGALARWNDGYYFTRCSRCGCDLVRPIDGNWRVPKGYRVVWRAPGETPPAPRPVEATPAAPAAAAPEPELSEEVVAAETEAVEALTEAPDAPEAAEPGGEADEAGDIETIEADPESSAHTVETVEPLGVAEDISESEEPLVLTEESTAETDETLTEADATEEVDEPLAEADEALAQPNEALVRLDDSAEAAEAVTETDQVEQATEAPAEADEAIEAGAEMPEAPAEPEAADEAPIARDDEPRQIEPAPGGSAGKLPIEEVLAHLRDNPEPSLPAEEPTEASLPTASVNPPPRNHWDFMGDAHEEKPEETWDIPLPPDPSSPPRQEQEPDGTQEQGRKPASRADRGRESGRPRVEPARADRGEPPRAKAAAAFSNPRQWRGGTGMAKLGRSHALIGAAVLAGLIVAILVLLAIAGRLGAPAGQDLDAALSGLEGGAAPGGDEETTFITASLLSCRTAPAREARRVKNLARGDRVRVLAHDGDWVSLSHRGRQCWALRRYTSAERPL